MLNFFAFFKVGEISTIMKNQNTKVIFSKMKNAFGTFVLTFLLTWI